MILNIPLPGRICHAPRTAASPCCVGHICAQNAADFLTKWIGVKKLKESVAYATNEYAKGMT